MIDVVHAKGTELGSAHLLHHRFAESFTRARNGKYVEFDVLAIVRSFAGERTMYVVFVRELFEVAEEVGVHGRGRRHLLGRPVLGVLQCCSAATSPRNSGQIPQHPSNRRSNISPTIARSRILALDVRVLHAEGQILESRMEN